MGLGRLRLITKAKEKKTWEVVRSKFEKRLGVSENKFLSLGGRVVLTNSIFTSLPIYFLFFFKAPEGVLKILMSF